MALYFVQKEVIFLKSTHFNVLNTGKYRQIFAGIGIWSPKYRYSGIGIYRIGNTSWDIFRTSTNLYITCIAGQQYNSSGESSRFFDFSLIQKFSILYTHYISPPKSPPKSTPKTPLKSSSIPTPQITPPPITP
jgi:hypothetical protein